MKSTYAFSVLHRNGWGTGFGSSPTHCHGCGLPIPDLGDSCVSRYGCKGYESIESQPDAPELKPGESLQRAEAYCYACCAESDRAAMIADGKATLYLTLPGGHFHGASVGDFTGVLKFPARVKIGAHNIAHVRYDAWFMGPDGKPWHGVQYGDNTQIIRCKRLKGE